MESSRETIAIVFTVWVSLIFCSWVYYCIREPRGDLVVRGDSNPQDSNNPVVIESV